MDLTLGGGGRDFWGFPGSLFFYFGEVGPWSYFDRRNFPKYLRPPGKFKKVKIVKIAVAYIIPRLVCQTSRNLKSAYIIPRLLGAGLLEGPGVFLAANS